MNHLYNILRRNLKACLTRCKNVELKDQLPSTLLGADNLHQWNWNSNIDNVAKCICNLNTMRFSFILMFCASFINNECSVCLTIGVYINDLTSIWKDSWFSIHSCVNLRVGSQMNSLKTIEEWYLFFCMFF